MKVFSKLKVCIAVICVSLSVPQIAAAQANDMSPILLIETGPSDNSDYRRMTFTKFLSGSSVRVAYKSYNRTEFIQVRDDTSRDIVLACTQGRAASLGDVQAYEREEARRKRRGQAPEIKRFCIKNIPNWENGNRKRYLDPIFNGMPHARGVN